VEGDRKCFTLRAIDFVGFILDAFASASCFYLENLNSLCFTRAAEMIAYEGAHFQTNMQGHDSRTNLAPQAVFDTLQVLVLLSSSLLR
jgi:hypothetical protein